jgi:hypothetical protein
MWIAPARFLLAAGILARDEPHEAHEGAGPGEAAEVQDLQQDGHGREALNAPEAPEPGHGRRPGLAGGQGRHLRVQGLRAGPQRRSCEEVFLQGPLGGWIGEAHGVDPSPPRLAPRGPGGAAEPVPEAALA